MQVEEFDAPQAACVDRAPETLQAEKPIVEPGSQPEPDESKQLVATLQAAAAATQAATPLATAAPTQEIVSSPCVDAQIPMFLFIWRRLASESISALEVAMVSEGLAVGAGCLCVPCNRAMSEGLCTHLLSSRHLRALESTLTGGKVLSASAPGRCGSCTQEWGPFWFNHLTGEWGRSRATVVSSMLRPIAPLLPESWVGPPCPLGATGSRTDPWILVPAATAPPAPVADAWALEPAGPSTGAVPASVSCQVARQIGAGTCAGPELLEALYEFNGADYGQEYLSLWRGMSIERLRVEGDWAYGRRHPRQHKSKTNHRDEETHQIDEGWYPTEYAM